MSGLSLPYGARGKRAERRRNPADLDVEPPVRKRPHARVQRERRHAVEILRADLGQQ